MKPQDLFTPRGDLNTSIADRIQYGDCWEWTGAITSKGYGNIVINKKWHAPHRLLWQTLVGPIPKHLGLDHLCLNKKCCNPDHLQPVTQKENTRRAPNSNTNKTHCKRGHPFNKQNTYIVPKTGNRRCKKCVQQQNQKQYHKNKTK